MVRLVQNPDDAGQVQAMKAWLQARTAALEAPDIHIITPDAVSGAASNHRADSFVGKSFAYRPYFTAAFAGQCGRFHAIGTTSGVRGCYCAAPIRAGADPCWRGCGGALLVWQRRARLTERLALLDRAKVALGQMSADVSHEINRPFAAAPVARTRRLS